MAKPETTNAHLHKVLTHRNYMHHVNLQKQLNVYDKQKKLVEKELLEITKVREAIQQINRTLPKKSTRIKKRGCTPNNSSKKYDSSLVMKKGKIVKEELKKQEEVGNGIANDKDEEKKVNEVQLLGEKEENVAESLIQSFPIQSEGESRSTGVLPKKQPYPTPNEPTTESNIEPFPQSTISRTTDINSNTGPMDNRIGEKCFEPRSEQNGHLSNMNDGKLITEKDDRKIRSQSTPNTGNTKLSTRRRPPYIKSCSAPNFPVQKLDEIKESGIKENEQCEIYRLPKTPTRMVNKDRYVNSDEDLYRKSLLANHANAGTKESGIEGNEQCEIYLLPKTRTRMVSEDNYSDTDREFYRKPLLANEANAEVKLPALGNRQRNIDGPAGDAKKTINDSNFGNDVPNLETEKQNRSINSSPVLAAFPKSDACFVQRSRPRSQTVCELERVKTKTAWNSPETQRRHKKSAQFLSTFPNNDFCIVDRPRARARTVSSMDNSFSEYGRPRSKTESGTIHPGHQQRSARDYNWFAENPRPRSTTVIGATENCIKNGVKCMAGMEYGRNRSRSSESVRLSEDECIAIKGKFRQIGHSVLAIALMKKIGKK